VIQKFPDWPPGARTASGTALQLYRYFVSQYSDFCRHNPFVLLLNELFVVVHFVTDSVRKLLGTSSYLV
jgi:hypothetical protein